jgi:hypothetical protein
MTMTAMVMVMVMTSPILPLLDDGEAMTLTMLIIVSSAHPFT